MSAALAFTIEDYADDLKAMRAEQDAIDREERARRRPIARALAMLQEAERHRRARFAALDEAEAGLVTALDVVTEAREAAEEAGELVIAACKLVAVVRVQR